MKIKSFFKNKVTIAITIIVLIIIMVTVYTVILNTSSIPSELYVKTNNSADVKCIKGGFNWNYLGRHVVADALSPTQMTYTEQNTIYVSPNQKLIFTNSNSYKMYNEDIRYYDEKLNETILGTDIMPVVMGVKSLSFNAPIKSGTYIVSITMNYYERGSVQYGLKVVVSQDISELEQYANTYVGDNSKVSAILDLLLYNNFRNGIELSTSEMPYGITVNYSNINATLDELEFNTLALFTLIQNIDVITYNIQNDENTNTLSITRDEVEQNYLLTIEELKNYITGDIKNIYGYTQLKKLSTDYTLEDASKDNCFVVTYIREGYESYNKEYNKEVLNNFVDKIMNKEATFIRIVSFNKEGNTIINDIKYVNNIFTLTTDYTRDTLSGESERTFKAKTYSNIEMSNGPNNDIASISLYNGDGEMYQSSDVYGVYLNIGYATISYID